MITDKLNELTFFCAMYSINYWHNQEIIKLETECLTIIFSQVSQ